MSGGSIFSNSIMNLSANTGRSGDFIAASSVCIDLSTVCKMDIFGTQCEHFFHFTCSYWCFELFVIINSP